MIEKRGFGYYTKIKTGGLFGDGYTSWFSSFGEAKEYLIEQEKKKLSKLKEQIKEVESKIKEIEALEEL